MSRGLALVHIRLPSEQFAKVWNQLHNENHENSIKSIKQSSIVSANHHNIPQHSTAFHTYTALESINWTLINALTSGLDKYFRVFPEKFEFK